MKKKIFTEILAFVMAFTVFISSVYYLGYKYMPVRMNYGATWNMYVEEPENTIDVMFVGSSLAYCDIIPAIIYDQTGLTSYIIGAPNMNSGISYYYLKQALETQTPKLIMLEATTFCFPETSEKDSKINIGFMPWSLNRIAATFKVAAPKERLGLLFPLYNYHSRWGDYSFNAVFSPRADSITDIWAGYTFIDVTTKQEAVKERKYDTKGKDFKENMKYLEKIIKLCDDKGIELELFIVPSCNYVSEETTELIRKNAGNTKLTRFNDNFEDLNFDLEKNFRDPLHLNFSGAEIFTRTMAEHITDNYSITPSKKAPELWKERVENYITNSQEFEFKEK
ncbi:MAG: hypothetical protein IKU52_03070 [Clostridia bacterium]|nr:hypothetical protein [Clostridia bacterium]